MNAQALAFVVHVGDIGGSAEACTDAWLEARQAQFARIRHRFILVPGDNEWSDCASLGLDPLQRLEHWRKLFCIRSPNIQKQEGPYCEHLRWEAGGWVFATLNVPGSNNNVGHPEHEVRMAAVFDWIEQAARLAERRAGLVLFIQANPFSNPWHEGYDGLRELLAELGRRLPGRVVLVHGDTHIARDDEPLPGLRRIEVWGSPFVGWRRVLPHSGEAQSPLLREFPGATP